MQLIKFIPVTLAILFATSLVSCGGMGVGLGAKQDFTPLVSKNENLSSVYYNWFYFSYDDSASTAGPEVVKADLNSGFRPSAALGRPWEFLNLEAARLVPSQQLPLGTLLSASPGLVVGQGADDKPVYRFGASVTGPQIDKAARSPLVLTLVIDISGSMGEPANTSREGIISKMELAKYCLTAMIPSFKAGDVINIVTFTDVAAIRLQNAAYDGSGAFSAFVDVVSSLQPLYSTDMDAGVRKGFAVAQDTFVSEKQNRVVIMTDAYANDGVVDPTLVSSQIVRDGKEGILFSGIGIGQDFNETFLDTLTEAGKGAYFLLATRSDANRIAGSRFVALHQVAAKEVRFKLNFPVLLKHLGGSSEQSSTDPGKVQTTNFSYNTSQYFYEEFGLIAEDKIPAPDTLFILAVTSKDPVTGQTVEGSVTKTWAELTATGEGGNIAQARLVSLLARFVAGSATKAEVQSVLVDYPTTIGEPPLVAEYRSLLGKAVNLMP